jgi:hypothetical protein
MLVPAPFRDADLFLFVKRVVLCVLCTGQRLCTLPKEMWHMVAVLYLHSLPNYGLTAHSVLASFCDPDTVVAGSHRMYEAHPSYRWLPNDIDVCIGRPNEVSTAELRDFVARFERAFPTSTVEYNMTTNAVMDFSFMVYLRWGRVTVNLLENVRANKFDIGLNGTDWTFVCIDPAHRHYCTRHIKPTIDWDQIEACEKERLHKWTIRAKQSNTILNVRVGNKLESLYRFSMIYYYTLNLTRLMTPYIPAFHGQPKGPANHAMHICSYRGYQVCTIAEPDYRVCVCTPEY